MIEVMIIYLAFIVKIIKACNFPPFHVLEMWLHAMGSKEFQNFEYLFQLHFLLNFLQHHKIPKRKLVIIK